MTKYKLPTYITFLSFFLLSTALLVGCDSSISESGQNGGTVHVLLTDAPIDAVAEAHVVIKRVELVGESGPPVVLTDEPQEFDLLELQNGLTADLAELSIPPGTYTQIRLIVDEEAYLIMKDSTKRALRIPSGAHTGIKINIPAIEITGNADEATIVLDFNAAKSFLQAGGSGQFIFKPVVNAKAVKVNGESIDQEIKVEGVITALTDTSIAVEGISFRRTDETEIEEEEDAPGLTEGRYVELEGQRAEDSTLVAVEVEVEDDEDLERAVKAQLDEVAASYVVMLGTRFEVTSETKFEDGADLSTLRAGEKAEIEFTITTDSTYLALEIEPEISGFDGRDEGEDDSDEEEEEKEEE